MKRILILLLFISFSIFLISLTIFPLEDSDIWFHLAAGKWIWQHKTMANPDPFSWPINNLAWRNLEWGIEVILYGIERLAGLNGIILAKAILITATFLLLLIFQNKKSGFSFWGIILLTVGVLASADRFMERVEHIGNFFLVLELGLLFRWKKAVNFSLLLFFPLTYLFWANTHPSVVLGAVLFFLFITGELMSNLIMRISDYISGSRRRYATIKRYVNKTINSFRNVQNKNFISSKTVFLMFFVLVLSVIFSLINPYFAEPYKTVLSAGREGFTEAGAYLTTIIEYQSPFARSQRDTVYVQLFFATFALYWLTFIFGSIKNGIRISYFLILSAVSYLGLTHVRHLNVFVLVGFLPAVGAWGTYRLTEKRIGNNYQRKSATNQRKSVIQSELVYSFVLLICISILVIASIYIMKNGYQLGRVYRTFSLGMRPIFADKALKFLDEQKINGNLFNAYGLGGYVIYKGYPERKVFMDGRAHYPEEFFMEHSRAGESGEKAREIMDKYKIDYVILLHPEGGGKVLADRLSDDKDNWALIYWDQYYLVYIRRKAEFSEVISRYEYAYADPVLLRRPEKMEEMARQGKDALKPKVRTAGELNRSLKLTPSNNRARIMLGGIFELIPDISEAQKQYEEAVRRDPKFSLGHFLLGNIYLRQGQAKLNLMNSPDIASDSAELANLKEEIIGWRKKAREEMAKSYSLDKEVVSPLNVLGMMEKEEGNIEEAVKYFTKAAVAAPNDPEAFFQLGIIYSNEKFDAEMAEYYLKQYVNLATGEEEKIERAKMILERLKR